MTPDPADGNELLLVTTRSRLRHVRHFPQVLRASLRVHRQLVDTDGLLCGASMVAGPTQFFTITVWRNRHAMQQFTRDGAHGVVMWNYPRWLSSLWLMRWRPDGTEAGSWGGLRLAPTTASAGERAAPSADPILDSMPELMVAMSADGAPAYESSPAARRGRRQVRDVRGALVRIRVPLPQLPGAILGLRRLRRQLLDGAGLAQGAVGIGSSGEAYFLGVWPDAADAERFLAHPWLARAALRWPDGFWSISLAAEGEFGTWDGRRLRRARRPRSAHQPS